MHIYQLLTRHSHRKPWAATTFCETEKNFRRVTGYHHLWMLKAHLDDEDGALAEMEKAG